MCDDILDGLILTLDYDELLKENIAEAKAIEEEKIKRRVARAKRQAKKQAKKQINKEIRKAKEIADKTTEETRKAKERADKAIEETRQEKEKIDKATNDAKNITLNLFKQNYPKENTSFLNHLSITQYHQIINLLINKARLNKIKAVANRKK